MTKPNVKIIDVHQLKNKMDADLNLCLIDVRELDEWQEVHIPGAHHIPKDHIISRIESKVTDKDTPIYLHCRGGIRSLNAAQCLIDMGYEEVYSIDGGIMEWVKQGYPVNE